MTDERRRQNVTHRLTGPGSPFELVEANIEGIACRVFRRGPRTLADVYRKAEASARCLYLVTDHCQVTCDEILRGANALGRALTNRLGAQVGTRVGIILRNRPEWPIAFIAATSIGAVATAIHRQQAAAELIAALDLAQCSVVIADEHFARELLELGDRRPVIVARDFASKGPAPTNWIFFDTLDTTTAAGSRATVSIDPEQEALIAFTSGSSSRAKGVVLTHRGIVTGMMNIMLGGAMSGMQTDRRMLETDVATRAAQPASFVAAPFSHVSGYFNLLLMAYMAGKVVTLPSWNPAAALELVCREQVRSLAGATPAMIREFLGAGLTHRDMRAFSAIGIHGSALPASLISEIQAAVPGVTIGTGYGLTETNGSVCVASGSQFLERPTTSGQPLPSVELRIVRDDGRDAGCAVGEIWVRGAMLMRGYCAAPEATAEVLHGGWFHTGDLGRLDAQGFLHVVDRRTNSIVCAGRCLCAGEVEHVLMGHPAVAEAAAVGVEHAPGDQRLVLCIVPRAGLGFAEAEIRRHVAAEGALQGIEAQLVRLESLPRTPSGKIDRLELRRRVITACAERTSTRPVLENRDAHE